MGRMGVGRFPDRAAALDYLVEKYSTKEVPARYTIQDSGSSCRAVLNFEREFAKGKLGEVTYSGNGADLSAAVVDLFKQLGEDINA